MITPIFQSSSLVASIAWFPSVDLAVKSVLILAAASVALRMMHRASAATRHLVWVLAVVATLTLPLLSGLVPQWRVLPAWLGQDDSPAATITKAEVKPVAAVAVTAPKESHPPIEKVVQEVGIASIQREIADGGSAIASSPSPIHVDFPAVTSEPVITPRRVSVWVILRQWATVAWVVGTAILALPILMSLVGLWRLGRRLPKIVDDNWESMARELSAALRLSRPVTLLRGRPRAMPMTWGVLHPKLVLPPEAEEWCTPRRRVVLMHELAHIKRRDFVVQFIVQMARAIYWFNPLMWVASRQIALESECACDDLVLGSETRPSDYAEHLLSIATGHKEQFLLSTAGVAMARSSRLKARLVGILDGRRNRNRLTVARVAILGCLLTAVILPLAAMRSTQAIPWAQQRGWTSQDVKPTSLTSPLGGWRNLPFSISTEEESDARTCILLAKKSRETLNGQNQFARPETRADLEKILNRRHGYFYAELLLGLWHQANGDAREADRWMELAYKHAPVVVVQRFAFADQSPLSSVLVQSFALECNRVENGSLDPSLELFYPNLRTDASGCIYLPVHDTVYRTNSMATPEGCEVAWPKLGWFQTSAKVAVLPSAIVTRGGQSAASDAGEVALSPTFGPVIEQTMLAVEDGAASQGLNFDTDERLDFPANFSQMETDARERWLRGSKINLFFEFPKNLQYWKMVGNHLNWSIVEPKSLDPKVEGDLWTQLSAKNLMHNYCQPREPIMAQADKLMGALALNALHPPITIAFNTKSNAGLMQITGFTENPRCVKIRYKLVQGITNSATATGVKASEKEEYFRRLAEGLRRLAREKLPNSKFALGEDGIIHIQWKPQQYDVRRSASKAGGVAEPRHEIGPAADGMILAVWMADEMGQAKRPQTLDNDDNWKTLLGEAELPEFKTLLQFNLDYGPQTDAEVRKTFGTPALWLAAAVVKPAGDGNTVLEPMDARERFLAIERIARLPAAEQAAQVRHLYRDLAPPCMSMFTESILSSYPTNILDRDANNGFDGNTAMWAKQLADAAANLSPEQVADKLEANLWINVAARARALQVLRANANATAALIQEDLTQASKASVQRAGDVILGLKLPQFTDSVLKIYLAGGEAAESAIHLLIFSHDRSVIQPLLAEVEKEPKQLIRHSPLFQGPLQGKKAEPALVKLLDAADVDVRVAAASALSECVDPTLAKPVSRLAREANPRLQEAALALAMKLPTDAFQTVRGDLLPLLQSGNHAVKFSAISSFAQRKDMAATSAILKALNSDSMAAVDAVTIMQALSALGGSTFGYDMHHWGPKHNEAALRKIESALKNKRALNGEKNTVNKDTDLANLKGTWKVRSLQGIPVYRWRQAAVGDVIQIDNVSTVPTPPENPAIQDYYTIKTSGDPKEMDVTYWVSNLWQTSHGIYRLDGDTLTICMAPYNDKTRPTKFKPGTGTLIEFERVKQGGPKPTAPATGPVDPKGASASDAKLSDKTQKILDALLADVEQVSIMLEHQPQEQPKRHSLMLSMAATAKPDFYLHPKVTNEQMKLLLAQLATSGYFDRAVGGPLPPRSSQVPPKVKNQPGYVLLVTRPETGNAPQYSFLLDLSLEADANVRALKGLRSVLTGEAAVTADTVLRAMGADPTAPPAINYGPATDGLQLALELDADKGVIPFGKPTKARLHFRNAGPIPITLHNPNLWQPSSEEFSVTDSEGKKVQTYSGWFSGWDVGRADALKGGQSVAVATNAIAFYPEAFDGTKVKHPVGNSALVKPGKYTVQYKLRAPTLGTNPLAWKGQLVSAPMTIEVVAAMPAPVSAPPAPTVPPASQPAPKVAAEQATYIDFSGTVVDDISGKPVPNFSVQGGLVDEKDPAAIKWGYTLQYTNSPNPTARFSSRVNWSGGWRSRIVADGYIGEPIMLKLPVGGAKEFEGLVIRLKRGRQVSGHLLDHTGKPVAGAGVFVVGNPSVNLTGGKAMTLEGGMREDKKAVRIATDASGAFTVTGIAADRHHIAVTCPTLDLWVVEVPEEGGHIDDLTIRLPEPGKLVVHYDIPGAPEKADIFLQYHTWDVFKNAGVSNQHYAPIVQHKEMVLNNLAPGTYVIDRTKNPGIAYKEARTLLDRREITIESGKTTTLNFVRQTGAPITGQIVGLEEGEVAKAHPTRVVVRVVPVKEDRWRSVVFDDITMESGGKPIQSDFVTEQLVPGQYKVRVQIYVPEKEEHRFNTGIVPPAFVGEAMVTVPKTGKTEPAQIRLKPWVHADGI